MSREQQCVREAEEDARAQQALRSGALRSVSVLEKAMCQRFGRWPILTNRSDV